MSLLDTASLIVTPNGYKESKLYSVIPSDGSGDLSVTRATTATRVNSAGLVELVPYNLLQYSEQFDNSAWVKNDVSATANTTTAPNGTSTADSIANNSVDNWHRFYQGSIANLGSPQSVTFSVYLKYNNHRYFSFGLTDDAFHRSQVVVDLLNGVITQNYVYNISDSLTSTITNVGNGWYRVTGTFNYTTALVGGNAYLLGYLLNQSTFTLGSYVGTGTSVYIWGAQAVEGSSAKDYQKTETRLNIPRLDYSNGTCPSILVEPQRTNLLTWSSSFDNAVWGAPSNVVANSVISPSGIQDADTLTGGLYRLQVFSATSYVFSFYAKKNTSSTFAMRVDAPTNNTFNFNLDTGVADSGATMEAVGNGWYRCYMPFTSGFAGTGVFYPNVNNDNLYIWGAQLELGSYATSYIPTTSASVTRNADVISKTGISSLIGQTEGAVMIDINIDSSFAKTDMRFIDVSDDSIANWYFIGTNNANEIRFYFRSSNTAYVSITTTLTNGRHKLAFAYANNDYVAYVDGVQVHSTTTLAVGSTSKVTLGNDFGGFNPSKQFINASALWKTRLTNTQLAQLTTI